MRRRVSKPGKTAALAAGSGLLVWLLLRGGGSASAAARRGQRAPVRIRIDGNGIAVNGLPTDQNGAVALAREASSASLVVTGSARQGVVDNLVRALAEAGVAVAGAPDVH